MTEVLVPELPGCLPAKGNRFSRWLGKALLKFMGWKVSGDFPQHKKVVVALGPHTSNWDFIIAMPAIMATGINANYLMKKEVFVWPFSIVWKWLGGVPLNRKATENTVEQLIQKYNESEKLWVAIAPEGTRKKVDYWKTGFLRVAEAAGVPVMLVAWDYPSKTFVLEKIWPTTGNHEEDAANIRAYVNKTYTGRYPNNQ